MTTAKSERLLNLLIMLLTTQRYLPKDRIRSELYADDHDEAFEKKFERDKDELRSLGARIDVGSNDTYFGDDIGYRIIAEESSLPDIELTADEAALLSLAGRTWDVARLAELSGAAVAKLAPAGSEQHSGSPTFSGLAELGAEAVQLGEVGFEELWRATLERREVSFGYRRAGSREVTERLVQPWGLVRYSGRWYLVGFDVDREAERIFRLSRVVGSLDVDPRADLYEVPAGTDIREIAQRLAPPQSEIDATVLVRRGAAESLRRRARTISKSRGPGEHPRDWELLHLTGDLRSLADDVLAAGRDAVAVTPEQLRNQVLDRLSWLASGQAP